MLGAGSKPSEQVIDAPTRADKLTSKTTFVVEVLIYILRIITNISEEQRNTWMIVATLVATATYQSALTPPGGIYQVNASDNKNAGKSVLSEVEFFMFLHLNLFSFFLSTIAIFIMTPIGRMGALVSVPMGWFVLCYIFSLWRISPSSFISKIGMFDMISIASVVYISLIVIVYSRLRRQHNLRH